MLRFERAAPLIRLPPPTGVEPTVSTRPSDPDGEKGIAAPFRLMVQELIR
jgi:hypothetical protein